MSNPRDITRITMGGESQTVEFKESLSKGKEGLKSLCGMLNSDVGHGLVLFGVAPDGSIRGVEAGNLDKAQRSLSQHIQQKFDPPIYPTIQVECVETKRVIVVDAKRVRSVPYHEYDGRAYIRIGTETRVLPVAEKDNLRRRRDRESHNGPWKCDGFGSWVGMLAAVEITANGPRKTYRCSCGGEFWPA
jgi:predicted HTH transcriptional regulator